MTIGKFGFELEFFFTRTDNLDDPNDRFVLLQNNLQPYADSCGYLLEARGEAHYDPNKARWLLHASILELQNIAKNHGLSLLNEASIKLPNRYRRLVMKRFGKGISKSSFMYGREYVSSAPRAGLHIHFSNQVTIDGRNGPVTISQQMDIPRIIATMDGMFHSEIKKARRIPGEYEMKAHGFEYRSLPATVRLENVVSALEEIRRM